MNKKQELCWNIVKNFGRLLSYDFWKVSIRQKDFPTQIFIRLIVIGAVSDILHMIFCKNFPEKSEA